MLPLKATPRETVELLDGNDKNRQIAGEAKPLPGKAVVRILDSRVRNAALDAQENIHRALAILRADLKVVEEAIQALELMAPQGRTEGCGPSVPRSVRKSRKVVDIHTNRV